MNLLLATLVVIFACWLFARAFSLWTISRSASDAQLEELRFLQGRGGNVVKGQLENPPATTDFRVIRGLEWRDGKYVSQSRLSIEAIKTAFFTK